MSHGVCHCSGAFRSRIRVWLSEVTKTDVKPNNPQSEPDPASSCRNLAKSGNEDDRRFIEVTAKQRWPTALRCHSRACGFQFSFTSIPSPASTLLSRDLRIASSRQGARVCNCFAQLFNAHHHGGIGFDLSVPGFTPPLLLRLIRPRVPTCPDRRRHASRRALFARQP